MSFDIFFQTCNFSDEIEEAVNSFTGEAVKNTVGECVTDAERNAIKELLASVGASQPEDGCYYPRFSDGSIADVFFDGLVDDPEFGGGMIALRGASTEIYNFMYSLADAGNLAIFPAMEGEVVLVTSDAKVRCVASQWPSAVAMESPEDLQVILEKGFDSWKKFRDKVAGDTQSM